MDLDAHLAATYRNAKTRSAAGQHIRVFATWYEDKFHQAFDPQLLTNYDMHLYREHSLKVEKVKASTWNARWWGLNILADWLSDTSLMDGVEQQGQVRGSTKHRSLTDDEYHRLIHTLEQNIRRTVSAFEYSNAVRDWATVMLMLHGLRVEECSLVNRDDVTINERSGYVLVRNGKGSKERTVPINLIARKALALWTEDASGAQWTFGSTRTLQRNVSQLGRQIGVPDLTPHWLRYTFAKRLERSGVPIETIRDLLGHESIETTRRYLRSSLDELQSAVEGVM
jgi:integrase/recombinase XerC